MKLSKRDAQSGQDRSFHGRPSPSKSKHNPKTLKVKSTGKIKKSKLKRQSKSLSKMTYDDYMNLEPSDSVSKIDQSTKKRVKLRPSKSDGSKKNLGVSQENGSKKSKSSKAIKGSSFIDFEAEEDNELELENDSFIVDDSDDYDDYGDLDVQGFLDRQAKEDNRFDFGEDDEDEDGNDDDMDENNVDAGEEEEEEEQDDYNDKDYADIPGTVDVGDEENENESFTPSGHKQSLQRLRNTDPEFYKYLAENDKKLLQFQVSDSEDDGDESEKFHKPAEELEIASDESDFEADDDEDSTSTSKKEGLITLKMVNSWQQELETDKSVETIANVIQAFQAALDRVTGNEGEGKYKVEGSSVFNAIVRLCILELQPALRRYLKMPPSSLRGLQPQKYKKWNKVKSLIKNYLQDLLKLMGGVSSPQVVSVLLKHLHQMAVFVSPFPNVVQHMLKQLTAVWGSGEETTRVVAFLCILRLCTNKAVQLDSVLKQMYLSYVSNAKFVSPSSLPGINFMRRSLVEIYRLDEGVSYQHVFLYVRQLAIHLRNAITLQKKEPVQAVLNWQFVHSLHLWAELLGAGANQPALQPLLYPLVQVIIGTIKLVPTTQYFPLRFHCVQIMINLSRSTDTFIPIMPFLLEVLNTYDFNRSHKKASMKPMDMTCILRVSKTEQSEVTFKDAVIEQIYQLMLECLATEANSVAFPDLVVAPIMQIKAFLKKCKIANYCRKMKSLLDKMMENSTFVEKERKLVTLNLKNRKEVVAFETNLKLKGPPLATFYASFQKVNKQSLKKRATDSDKLGEFNLPTLKKHKPKSSDDGPVVLFPSDSDSDDNFGSPEPDERKKKRTKKTKKTKTQKKSPSKPQMQTDVGEEGDVEDLVQDLRLEDL